MAFRMETTQHESCDNCEQICCVGNPVIVFQQTSGRGAAAEKHVIFICVACLQKKLLKLGVDVSRRVDVGTVSRKEA